MEIAAIVELISTVGFPIVCVFGLCWFIWKIYKASEKREEVLREEIKENRQTNAKFAEIISHYSTDIKEIKDDIKEIKDDIVDINEKIV